MNCSAVKTPSAQAALLFTILLVTQLLLAPASAAYVLNYAVADMRQPSSLAGTTACPQRMRVDISTAGHGNRQWSTSLSVSPVTILTVDQTPVGSLSEIETSINQSFAAWTGVSGSALTSSSLSALARTANPAACAADGVDTLCFNQADAAFTTGVLAFTRVITADTIGERASAASAASTFIGQILDADILLRPGDATIQFATSAALPANPGAYDLVSVLTHEMGHLFGLGHSGIWRAVMFPFVPPSGTFAGTRSTPQSPDAPLSDDDRTAVRTLYPDPSDTTHIGSISGHILPANPAALAGQPGGATGMFAAQVVALDVSSGAVAGAALSGWSCSNPGPPAFDGSYRIEHLLVGPSQTYQLYVEPLDGPVSASDALEQTTLCRNTLSDPGWPPQFTCTTPSVPPPFSTTIRSGP